MNLAGSDNDGNPRRETGHDRVRDELDDLSEPHQPGDDQDGACHQGREDETVIAVDRDIEDDHHERAGGTAYLNPRAPEGGDKQPRNDSGDQPLVRRCAAGDRKRHRERKGNDRHREPRDRVGSEVR